ncbi:MAG: extracellular solute-binding protein [Hyphomicrobiaceae bacterium]
MMADDENRTWIGWWRRLAASAAVGLSLLATPVLSQAVHKLTVVSWGGAYADSQKKSYIDPYKSVSPSTTIELINAGGEQVAQLRSQTAIGSASWDLVDVSAADAIRLCQEGIAMPVPHDILLSPAPDGTPPTQDFGQTIISECFIPEIVYSTTFGYRTDRFKEAPTKLCDVFDLEKFPGMRALEERPINNLEWALICDGVAAESVYAELETPDGLDRALAKLATLDGHIRWWKDGAEPAEWLAKGEVVIASAYNGRLFNIMTRKGKKTPVAMLWDWQAFDFDGWIVPKTTQNLNEVLRFVRFATSTERLAAQASYISYGPARRSSSALVGKHAELGIDMAPYLPTAPENAKNVLIYNYDWWAQNRDRIDARFQTWLATQQIR